MNFFKFDNENRLNKIKNKKTPFWELFNDIPNNKISAPFGVEIIIVVVN